MKATLYTFGYQCGRAARIVADLQHIQHPFPFVDVRNNPDDGKWEWKREYLRQQQSRMLYYWIKNLGNAKYQASMQSVEPIIEIVDMDSGLEELAPILEEHGRAAIFCACANGKRCHRMHVALAARERLGVQVVHL
jgi:uncharacterized protein (DUF488 family)